MILEIAILVSLFLSHYLCDFTFLSTPKMLEAKKTGKPIRDILDHGIIHGIGIAIVLYLFGCSYEFLIYPFSFEVITHTTIDVLKGKMNVWFPVVSNPANKSYWLIFGLDQFLHTLVIIIIYFIAINNLTR